MRGRVGEQRVPLQHLCRSFGSDFSAADGRPVEDRQQRDLRPLRSKCSAIERTRVSVRWLSTSDSWEWRENFRRLQKNCTCS